MIYWGLFFQNFALVNSKRATYKGRVVYTSKDILSDHLDYAATIT